MNVQSLLKRGALLPLMLIWMLSAHAQEGVQSSPDMSYQKTLDGQAPTKAVSLSTAAGYFDDLAEARKTPDQVVRLNLQGHQLKSIPSDLCSFPNLQELDLSHNQIKSIEAGFSCPASIRRLYLNNNQLTELPAKLTQLTQLQVLVAFDNPITKIDPAIGTMQTLRELWLSGDGTMASFQPTIWNLHGLETLRLWNFGLTQISDDIANMTNLKTVCFQNNHLLSLNPKVCALPQLNYLNLGKNLLSGLPIEIRKCTRLGYLGIYENPLTVFPEDFALLSKNLERLSAWKTEVSPKDQSQITAAFPKTIVLFEPIDIH